MLGVPGLDGRGGVQCDGHRAGRVGEMVAEAVVQRLDRVPDRVA
jgi:hypothetical protein